MSLPESVGEYASGSRFMASSYYPPIKKSSAGSPADTAEGKFGNSVAECGGRDELEP